MIQKTHQAMLTSGAGQDEAQTQQCFLCTGGHFLARSTHLSRDPLHFAFLVHCGFPSFWVSDFATQDSWQTGSRQAERKPREISFTVGLHWF